MSMVHLADDVSRIAADTVSELGICDGLLAS